jgi:condensin complex subunit 2
MKMATDNKINAANSWNFALIDYFHDMSLLKEGDGVNFQKASCTLDGCVKIYTSRVDSVATETGKLLSGLADSGNNKKKRGEEGEGEESDEEEVEDEDGVVRKKPKKRVCSTSLYLVLGLYYDTDKSLGSTLVRSHTGTFVCLFTAEKVRARIFCGSAI